MLFLHSLCSQLGSHTLRVLSTFRLSPCVFQFVVATVYVISSSSKWDLTRHLAPLFSADAFGGCGCCYCYCSSLCYWLHRMSSLPSYCNCNHNLTPSLHSVLQTVCANATVSGALADNASATVCSFTHFVVATAIWHIGLTLQAFAAEVLASLVYCPCLCFSVLTEIWCVAFPPHMQCPGVVSSLFL